MSLCNRSIWARFLESRNTLQRSIAVSTSFAPASVQYPFNLSQAYQEPSARYPRASSGFAVRIDSKVTATGSQVEATVLRQTRLLLEPRPIRLITIYQDEATLAVYYRSRCNHQQYFIPAILPQKPCHTCTVKLEGSVKVIITWLRVCPARLVSQLQPDSASVIDAAHLSDLVKMIYQRDNPQLVFFSCA